MDIFQTYGVPTTFAAYLQDNVYTIDSIGMSGSTVLTFEKWVLKIEPVSTWALRTVEMLRWLDGKLPSCP